MPETAVDTHYLEADKLIEAMHGRSTTGKWDVLVAYKADKLSKLLAEVWAKDKNTKVIDVADQHISFGSNRSYHLELGKPLLAFEPSDGDCRVTLTIALSGTVNVNLYKELEDDKYEAEPYKVKKIDVPKDSYNLKISVPAKSVSGSATAGEVDTHGKSSSSVFALGEESAHIVLHFSSQKAVYSIDPVTPATGAAPTGPNPLEDAVHAVQKWFSNKENVSSIDYKLATVKAIKDPSDANSLLKPKSFIFGANGDVLCIYLRTEGSGAEDGDTEAKFTAIDGSMIRPIPRGSSASIIVAHRLLHEKVFLPQLKDYQTSHGITDAAKAVTWTENTKGFAYQFRLKGDFDVSMSGENGVFAQVSIPKVKVHLDDDLTTLKIEDNKAAFSFSKYYPVKWTASSFGSRLPSEYEADFIVELKQDKEVAKVEQNQRVALDISIAKESFELKKKERKGHLYEGVKNATVAFEAVALKSPNLDFIAAESVLAPGMTMVNVQKLYVPYDLIMTGDMVEHATS